MKVTILVTVLLLVTTQSECVDWGGAQVILKQSGLNIVTDFIHERFVHLIRKTSFGETKIFTLIINNVHVNTVDGIYTTVVIKPNNTILFTAGFKSIHIEANITVNNRLQALSSPKTIVNFTDASLRTTLHIGRGSEGGKIDVEGCEASVASMQLEKDSGELGTLIRTVWNLERTEISKYLKDMCPLLRDFIRKKFEEITKSGELMKVSGDGPTPFPIDVQLNAMSTVGDKVYALIAVGLEGAKLPVFGSGDIKFPDPAELGHDNTKDIEVWFGQDLIDILLPRALYIDTVIPTSFMAFTSDRDDFKVTALSKTYSTECTDDGMAFKLSFNTTLIQQSNTSQNCVVLNTTTVAILPFTLAINNTRFEARPNPHRYTMNTTITSWDVAYTDCGPINPETDPIDWQKQVLRKFTKAFENNYNDQLIFMRMVYDTNFISPVDTTVETLKGSLVFTANIARDANITTEKTIRTEHKNYTHRRVLYTYSDNSQELLVDGQPFLPTSKPPAKVPNMIPIAVGVVGGVVLIAAGILVSVLIYRRRRPAPEQNTHLPLLDDDEAIITT